MFHGGIGVVHLLFSLQGRVSTIVTSIFTVFHAIFTVVFVLFHAFFTLGRTRWFKSKSGWFALRTRWLGTTSKNAVEETSQIVVQTKMITGDPPLNDYTEGGSTLNVGG